MTPASPRPGRAATAFLRDHPTRGAALGVLVAALVSVLPWQIDWADTLGSRAGAPDWPTGLRLLTVSPTLLHADEPGAVAYAHEAGWLAVFLVLLLVPSRALARRCRVPAHRPGALALAMVVLAPPANLLAMAAQDLPDLLTEPVRRGDLLAGLLTDAQNWSLHAIVLALAGFLGALVVCRRALSAHAAPRVAALGNSWRAHRGLPPTANGATNVGETAMTVLLLLRGPMETLWRRIGATFLTTCAAALLLLLSAPLTGAVAGPFADAVCAPGGDTTHGCVDQLVRLIRGPLPGNGAGLSAVYFRYTQIYALIGFAATFAVTHFVLRGFSHRPARPLHVLLVAPVAYVVATVEYAVLLEIGVSAGWMPGYDLGAAVDDLPGMLLPPHALQHTLLAAPVVAVLLGLCSWAYGRVRRRRGGTAAGSGTEASGTPQSPRPGSPLP